MSPRRLPIASLRRPERRFGRSSSRRPGGSCPPVIATSKVSRDREIPAHLIGGRDVWSRSDHVPSAADPRVNSWISRQDLLPRSIGNEGQPMPGPSVLKTPKRVRPRAFSDAVHGRNRNHSAMMPRPAHRNIDLSRHRRQTRSTGRRQRPGCASGIGGGSPAPPPRGARRLPGSPHGPGGPLPDGGSLTPPDPGGAPHGPLMSLSRARARAPQDKIVMAP